MSRESPPTPSCPPSLRLFAMLNETRSAISSLLTEPYLPGRKLKWNLEKARGSNVNVVQTGGEGWLSTCLLHSRQCPKHLAKWDHEDSFTRELLQHEASVVQVEWVAPPPPITGTPPLILNQGSRFQKATPVPASQAVSHTPCLRPHQGAGLLLSQHQTEHHYHGMHTFRPALLGRVGMGAGPRHYTKAERFLSRSSLATC